MLSYGVAVLLGLIAVTLAGVKTYKILRPKLARYEKYVPNISAIILAVLAIVIIF